MANIMGIVAVCLTGAALLFSILACALQFWGKVEVGSTTEINYGLWKICTTVSDETECESITKTNIGDEEAYDELTIVKAMVMLGLILTVPALVVGILVLFVLKDKKILFFVAGGIDILAGLFLMVGFAYFVSEVYDSDNDNNSLGAAFALDIVAWLFAWIGGALFFVAKIMDKE